MEYQRWTKDARPSQNSLKYNQMTENVFTWKDCESIPVENVAITIAQIAIKKL